MALAMWGCLSRGASEVGADRLLAAAAPALTCLLLSGCASILGVEDVVSEGGGGAGGGSSSTEVTIGAGLPTSSSTGDTNSASDAASTGTGVGCTPALPPCEGALASAFESNEELLLGWDVDATEGEAEIKGGKLELQPDDDDDEGGVHAAVASKTPVVVAAAGACSIWVELEESSEGIVSGLALGTGDPSGDSLRVERRGGMIVARVGATDVGSIPVVDGIHYLRLGFDPAGTVSFEVSAQRTCWEAVAAPQARTVTDGRVRLYAEGGAGRARFDDFCR